jgi:hypothetical protein
MSELRAEGPKEPPTAERLETLLAAYGGKPAHWPKDERAQVEAFIHANAKNLALLNDALAIDRALDTAPDVTVSAALSARILDSFDRMASRPSVQWFIRMVANVVWPGAPVWQPSAALAASLVVGLMLGVMLPLGSQAQSAHTTDVSAAFSPVASDNDRDP